MSALHDLLSACISQGSTRNFKLIRESYLLDEELDIYRAVRDFFRNHGQLPSHQTLSGMRHPLPLVGEPSSFYLERLKQRFAYGLVSPLYSEMSVAVRQQNVARIVQLARQMTAEASAAVNPQTYASGDQVADAVEADYREAREAIGMLRGVTLGFPTVDMTLGGARGGDIIVWAGRPGHGKSYVLLTQAEAAWRDGKSVAFITMEMSTLEMGHRRTGIRTGINPEHISRGELPFWAESIFLSDLDEQRTRAATVPYNMLAGDFSKSTAGVEAFILEHSPDIVFIDAAYLLTAEGQRKGYLSKWENMAEVIAQIKVLAIRYNIPFIISVQLNRNADQKADKDKELDLSDVAGTDAIPQDATAVYGLRLGAAPNELTRRRVQNLKSRRGRAQDFTINFGFSPTDFSEIDDDSMSGPDLSHMI